VQGLTETSKAILCDPQTSGGLLVAVAPDHIEDFLAASTVTPWTPVQIGRMVAQQDAVVTVV
jgi:selenide,water dikinase